MVVSTSLLVYECLFRMIRATLLSRIYVQSHCSTSICNICGELFTYKFVLLQDETALMAMVEDFKLKAARKRERAQSLLLKSDTAVYKAAMAVHLAQAAEDLGSAEKVADLLDDNDNNSVKDDT